MASEQGSPRDGRTTISNGLCAELVAFAQSYLREHPAPRRRKEKTVQIDRQMLADMLACIQVPSHQVKENKCAHASLVRIDV